MPTARKTKKLATKAEREIATSLGGRLTFNSGAGDEKGDSRVAQRFSVEGGQRVETVPIPMRIENKTTTRSLYRLHVRDWWKLRVAAGKAGENPLFHARTSCTDRLRVTDVIVMTKDFYVNVLSSRYGVCPEVSEEGKTTNLGREITLRRFVLQSPEFGSYDLCAMPWDRELSELIRSLNT